MSNTSSSGLDERFASWFVYLFGWITGILFLILERRNKTIRLHAYQATILSAAMTVVCVILSLLSMIPFLGILFAIINWIVVILYILVIILCIIRAANGSILSIPIVYDLAKKYAQCSLTVLAFDHKPTNSRSVARGQRMISRFFSGTFCQYHRRPSKIASLLAQAVAGMTME